MKPREYFGQPSITRMPISALIANPRNSRTHSRRQIRQIAASIEMFGFTNPILIDDTNTLIAGHGRVEAAKLLGINELPTIRLEGLTADQIRAYVIADNRLAERAGWDQSILAIELQHLLTIDADLDITVTGFEVPEIDLILSQPAKGPDKDDAFETDLVGPPVAQSGDLWLLNKHRVFCGSSVEQSSYTALMGIQKARVVFLDPPYNLKIDRNVCGFGSIHHQEFAMGSGEMTDAEFLAFLTTSLRLVVRHSSNGSVHFVCMDWRHASELLAAGEQVYDSLLNMCVWTKDKAGLGSFYRSQHELIFVFRNGKEGHRNNVQLGKYGRHRTNVWPYPGVRTLSKQSDEGNLLALHPTVKPVALVADALLDSSARGDIVLDAFLGSGSTLIASERVGRACYGIEISPPYIDVSIRRWQRQTGDRAIHAATKKSFDELAAASEAATSPENRRANHG